MGKELWERIEQTIAFTDKRKEFLRYIIDHERTVTQKDIAKKFGTFQSNISTYYIKPLKDAGIIEEQEVKNKVKYFGLTTEYLPLKDFISAAQRVQEKAKSIEQQMPLF
ncbi:MAG: winged helix-turn-helix transcriptional regulator [Candidatus Kerfeldbacteria bacterium]|nr:winged helix-turn-helix transcriptional regulator [Candidatus Kerfeldbacteria bacterium]